MPKHPLDETQLHALLRLKRYEQPPPRYFDDLLSHLHRCQREELLRRPAWRIAMDRVRAFIAPFRIDWAHTASMAVLLVLGIAAIRVALPERPAGRPEFAEHRGAVAGTTLAAATKTEPAFTLQPRSAAALASDASKQLPGFEPAESDGPTRFIIDTQPVSYEATQIRF
jgi:hypothetical protein